MFYCNVHCMYFVSVFAQNPIVELVSCVPGITGVVITLALVVIVSSSMEVIRCDYFTWMNG